MALVPIFMGKRFGGTMALPYIPLLAAAEGIYLWKFYRGMSGITFLSRPKLTDMVWSLATLATLWLTLLWLALWLKFPQPLPELANNHSLKNILSVTIAGITSSGFVENWARKILVTALVEELLYRGILLNFWKNASAIKPHWQYPACCSV